jgi:hypothetical protein
VGAGSSFHVLRSRTRFRRYQGRRRLFSCFTLPDSFRALPRASGLVFKFCAPGNVFGGTEGVGSRFNVLSSRTLFGRYRRRRGSFSSFALPDTFLAVLRAAGLIFMFCAPGLFLGITEGVGARFHVFRSRTRFRRYQGRRRSFSCFALPDSFWALPRASGLVFKFCSTGNVFCGTDGVGSHFHVLSSRTLFGRHRGRRVPYSCFVLPYSFRAVPTASGPVFMFCAPEHVFGGNEGVGSRFHVLRSRTLFRCYRRRWVPYSCSALPDTFCVVPRASGLVYMFCAPGLFLGVTVGAGSRIHVLRSRTHFGRY